MATLELKKLHREFRSAIPRQTMTGAGGSKWIYFEYGPKDMIPLVLVPGTSGTADVFFQQVTSLGARGYRVIAVQYPPYWSHYAWVRGFADFLKRMHINKCHLFGTSLGGYLALHFTATHPSMVESLILCNAFCDTINFKQSDNCISMFRYLPEFYLKKYLLDSFPEETDTPEAVDFTVELLETLKREDLGSRLTLNCLQTPLSRTIEEYDQKKITLLDTNDDVVLPDSMRQRLYAKFPQAKMAIIKQGGDFPFLSVPDEVTMHIQVHLRCNGLFPQTGAGTEEAKQEGEVKDAAAAGAGGEKAAVADSNVTAAASTDGARKTTVFLPLSAPGRGGFEPREPETDEEVEKKQKPAAPATESTPAISSSSSAPAAAPAPAPATSAPAPVAEQPIVDVPSPSPSPSSSSSTAAIMATLMASPTHGDAADDSSAAAAAQPSSSSTSSSSSLFSSPDPTTATASSEAEAVEGSDKKDEEKEPEESSKEAAEAERGAGDDEEAAEEGAEEDPQKKRKGKRKKANKRKP